MTTVIVSWNSGFVDVERINAIKLNSQHTKQTKTCRGRDNLFSNFHQSTWRPTRPNRMMSASKCGASGIWMRRVTNDTNPRLTAGYRRVPTNDGVSRPTWTRPPALHRGLIALIEDGFGGNFKSSMDGTLLSLFMWHSLPSTLLKQSNPFNTLFFFRSPARFTIWTVDRACDNTNIVPFL